MISGLLSQLQNQYRMSPMPDMSQLQQAQMLQNLQRTRSGVPNYGGLLGVMGVQPSTAFERPIQQQAQAQNQMMDMQRFREMLYRNGLLQQKQVQPGLGGLFGNAISQALASRFGGNVSPYSQIR